MVAPLNVNQAASSGFSATRPPKYTANTSSTAPISETSSTRPGRIQRTYAPMNSAIGMVSATVNVPQGLPTSAFTTISAITASRITMIARMPTDATVPANGPISARIMSPSERPSRRVERNRITQSCTAPASTTPAISQSMPGR
jgi:hypothetical protein